MSWASRADSEFPLKSFFQILSTSAGAQKGNIDSLFNSQNVLPADFYFATGID
jgi:hypothetical protein